MIYSTLCVGKNWVNKHKDSVEKISKDNKIFVTTDEPNSFFNANTIQYTREEFSYYEKIISLLKLCVEHKQRVTHFDVDLINTPKFNMILENKCTFNDNTIYSNRIFKNENFEEHILRKNPATVVFMNIIRQLKCDFIICNYLHENIISVPYMKDTSELLLNSVLSIQSLWENLFCKGRVWIGKPHNDDGVQECNKWSKNGCGYAEGGSLSLYAKKYNIPIERIKLHDKYIM